jgi:23S rRNA (cytosine1962-C5)-methyltransferase
MNDFKIIEPLSWNDYELIDTGGAEKLERFGKYIIRRPEPQAVWDKYLPVTEWENMAHAAFRRDKADNKESEKGEWHLKKGMPEQWFIDYNHGNMHLTMRLGLTSFKHVGIFPEQSENWRYIYNAIKESGIENTRILNLFAYTGGASLAAKAAGADVVHVDSVKQVINWSAVNMEASGLKDIRWVIEDAMKYIKREVKRGKTYHGIILDPPAYGRGPDGEKWILEDQINEFIFCCSKLLEEKNSFFIMNLYSMGFSALIAENLIKFHFHSVENVELGELCISDRDGRRLPLGVFTRFKR